MDGLGTEKRRYEMWIFLGAVCLGLEVETEVTGYPSHA
jgi:hypothetical protein